MSARSSTVKRRLRARLAKRRGARCARCGETRGPLTLDHVIPLSKGGTWKRSNLQLLCERCNADKGDRMPWEVEP